MLKSKTFSLRAVVGRMAASKSETSEGLPRGNAPRGVDRSKSPVSGQAALDSIWVTLLGAAPLIAIRRGFIASGISRCRSMTNRPFSTRAPLTSTWSASVNWRLKLRAEMP